MLCTAHFSGVLGRLLYRCCSDLEHFVLYSGVSDLPQGQFILISLPDSQNHQGLTSEANPRFSMIRLFALQFKAFGIKNFIVLKRSWLVRYMFADYMDLSLIWAHLPFADQSTSRLHPSDRLRSFPLLRREFLLETQSSTSLSSFSTSSDPDAPGLLGGPWNGHSYPSARESVRTFKTFSMVRWYRRQGLHHCEKHHGSSYWELHLRSESGSQRG